MTDLNLLFIASFKNKNLFFLHIARSEILAPALVPNEGILEPVTAVQKCKYSFTHLEEIKVEDTSGEVIRAINCELLRCFALCSTDPNVER